jgi:carbamoyltransferase
MHILGISAYYHDSAAVLIRDGEIIAAAQEERFSRKKHDPSFPAAAIRYCLKEGNIHKDNLDAIVFYDKPILKFHRILQTHFSVAPRGLKSFIMTVPVWMKRKLWIPLEIENHLQKLGIQMPKDLFFIKHHQSHAASAFFPSPFQRAAILTVDGVGEWSTSTIGTGQDNHIEIIKEILFPHSIGLLYSAFTFFTGFKVNSGEYKLMGLAPYGEPVYVKTILDHLIDLKEDGSFHMNMAYFGYLDKLAMTNNKFHRLFGGPPRKPETEITQREMDIARSIQAVTEEIILRMAKHTQQVTGEKNLCLAGGVALNCVANGRILREGPFDDIWIQPAAGDAGGALGAALFVWHQVYNKSRPTNNKDDTMHGSLLGPKFSNEEIEAFIRNQSAVSEKLEQNDWAPKLAKLMADGNVVGLFSGRMEFGPRALGSRSILGDPRSSKMQSIMNLKIKFRESFRPFAPSCLEEKVSDYFELDQPSPYMLIVAPVKKEKCYRDTNMKSKSFRERIHQARSDLPAITHVDYTARIQTVNRNIQPRFYELIKAFETITGYGVMINTSFNVRGEPIVCSLEDAYKCFMRTEMDYLVMENYLLDKKKQPAWHEKSSWRKDLILD